MNKLREEYLLEILMKRSLLLINYTTKFKTYETDNKQCLLVFK